MRPTLAAVIGWLEMVPFACTRVNTCPACAGADVQPSAQRRQGIRICPPAFGDGDYLADGVGVAFGPAYGDQQPTRFGCDVRDFQGGEFRSAQG